ncbi:hypothetical protein QTN25_001737 [Entamoeba marina]
MGEHRLLFDAYYANIFPRIETQHLYTSSDVKLPNIHQYIYWKSLNYIEYLQRNTQNERYPNVCLSYKDYSVDPIKMNAIHPCELFKTQFPLTAQTINFPTSIHHLSTRALTALQNLTSLTIPTSIVSLGESCCGSLTSLQNVVILKSIYLPEAIEMIDLNCFEYCNSLQTLKIPPNIKSLTPDIVSNCSSLETLVLPISFQKLFKFSSFNCPSLFQIEYYDQTDSIVSKIQNVEKESHCVIV